VRGRPILLLTNDDGIAAAGLTALSRSLEPLGELWVVAPESERSGASHSLTLRRPLAVRWLGERTAGVAGTPADAVLLAVSRLLPAKPDLVVSGINHGPNLGDDVNYSGTVGAAMEGVILGVPGLAVSLASRSSDRFELAAACGALLARRILGAGLPPGCMLNVNVPDLPRAEVRGLRVVRLARRTYEDMIREEPGPGDMTSYSIGNGHPVDEDGEGTDCRAIAEGYVTVTPLGLDMTDHDRFDGLREWVPGLFEPGRVP
jgi:5'-nucleotidase